mgnify:FL=1
MKRHDFTLVELLMAIGIIVILAAISIPTALSAIKKAETAKAQAEMTALVTALKNYESTYGFLPFHFRKSSNTSPATDGEVQPGDYSDFIKVLQGENLDIKGRKMNPRKLAFLEIQGNSKGEYEDPWGNDYTVVIDGDGDGKIIQELDDWKYYQLKVEKDSDNKYALYQSILIISKGPDGEMGDDKASLARDNVLSIPVIWDKSEETWVISH